MTAEVSRASRAWPLAWSASPRPWASQPKRSHRRHNMRFYTSASSVLTTPRTERHSRPDHPDPRATPATPPTGARRPERRLSEVVCR